VTLCPCGTGLTYPACCGRLHRGEAHAPTAEALMRSRFSAFALGDADYLLASWHSSTRPASIELGRTRWLSLEVVSARGGLFDTEGAVEFRATHEGGVMHERSRFVKQDGRWLYLDGT
jgi:SEC-C motif-containing protein